MTVVYYNSLLWNLNNNINNAIMSQFFHWRWCIMQKLTEEQRRIAIGRLPAGANQGDIARHWGGGGEVCRATINTFWVCCNNTGSTYNRPRSGRPREITPTQDWYIWLMQLQDRFRKQPPQLVKFLDWDDFPHKTVISRQVRLVFKPSSLCDPTSSRHIILLNGSGGVARIWWKHAQWRTGCVSHESYYMILQMHVPESIDVIINGMPPIVFWNMIVLVVVMS